MGMEATERDFREEHARTFHKLLEPAKTFKGEHFVEGTVLETAAEKEAAAAEAAAAEAPRKFGFLSR